MNTYTEPSPSQSCGLSAGATVFTAGGPRLAGSLRVGDRLLTHAGRYRAVIGRAVFDSQAMVTLAPWGVPEHAATALAPGTPVWARAVRRPHGRRRVMEPATFIPAGELRAGDRVGFPVVRPAAGHAGFALGQGERAPLLPRTDDEGLWFLLGAWLAVGTAPRGGAVRLALGDPRSAFAAAAREALSDVGGRLRVVRHGPERHSAAVSCPALRAAAEWLVVNPRRRRVPEALHMLEAPLRRALLAGFYGAHGFAAPVDGHAHGAGALVRSPALAEGLRRLLLAEGVFATVTRASPGRHAGAWPRWAVRPCRRAGGAMPRAWFERATSTWWVRLASVATAPPSTAVSLLVEGDGTVCSPLLTCRPSPEIR